MSMRVIRPTNVPSIDNDGHMLALEDVEQARDRRIRRDGVESRAHHARHRAAKSLGVANDREQHVRLVDDADDPSVSTTGSCETL